MQMLAVVARLSISFALFMMVLSENVNRPKQQQDREGRPTFVPADGLSFMESIKLVSDDPCKA